MSSLLESSAAEAIAELTLTTANYHEATATLKKQFGNPQLIVNRYMDALLNTPAILLHQDVKGLRRLYDSMEAHIRGLQALGIAVSGYGDMLSSVIVNKLPPEIRLLVMKLLGIIGILGKVMSIVGQAVNATERAAVPTTSVPSTGSKLQRQILTAANLVSCNSELTNDQVECVYCGQGHTSGSCSTVSDIAVRKEILRKAGRCYTCLKW